MGVFNPRVFDALLAARSLTLKDLSVRMHVSEDELRDQVSGNQNISGSALKTISSELAVPPFVLFMEVVPTLESPIVDFRSNNIKEIARSRVTIESIEYARRIQERAIQFDHADNLVLSSVEQIKSSAFALEIRQSLGIKDIDQIESATPSVFYAISRAAIERTGVFVLHESFPPEDGSGFCLADTTCKIIVVNTRRQTPGRRLFTLMHEFAHALLRSTGTSDPFVTANSIEKACNQFAANFLMPRNLIASIARSITQNTEFTTSQVYLIAKELNISQEATIVQLERFGLASSGAHESWLASVREAGNPDRMTKTGGGGAVPQEKVKLAKYGFTFAKVFGEAVWKGNISPLEVFRSTGLKPKYQNSFFAYAGSAHPVDADAED